MTTAVRPYSPTPSQEGMVFHSQLAPGAGLYVQQLVVALPEEVDVAAMHHAWQFVASRFDAMRMTFARDEDGCATAQVVENVELPFIAFDADAATFSDWLGEDRARGFDPASAPLARAALVRIGTNDCRLVFTFHHALLDGRSHRIVLETAFAAYEAFRDDTHPSIVPGRPFADHLAWLDGQPLDGAEAYYRNMLRGFQSPTPLPDIRPQSDTGGNSVAAHVPIAPIAAFAAKRGLTLAAIVQAAWAVALGRYAGQDDVVFGSTRSGRRPEIDGVASTVGLLINTLPIRAKPDPERPLDDFLRVIRRKSLDVRPFDHAPPTAVQEWSEVPAGSPLYETIVVVENYRLNEAMRGLGGSWENRSVELHESPHYAFALAAAAGICELELRLHYDGSRVEAGTAKLLLDHVARLIVNAPAFADRPLRNWPMLTDAERAQRAAWNDTTGDYPSQKCVHHLFEDWVARTPDAAAVIHEGVAWTYRELDARANCLAWHLRGLGIGPGRIVAVCMNRSADMVVAVLGILKAGAAYVPFDPAYPKERIAFILADTQAAALVTQVRRLERLPDVATPVVCIDADWPTVSLHSADRPPCEIGPEAMAYVIYTSGSTGTPKGVVMRHRAVVNTLDWVNRTFNVGPDDRVLWVTSLCFDLSVYDIFGVLAAGGSVRVASGSELRDPEQLAAILTDEPITLWDSAPPLLAQLAPHFGKARDRASLRLVLLSGDWIPVALPDKVRAAFPGVEVVSLGGATEAAIWSNYYRIGAVNPAWTSIPYGRPIRNARYYLLDHHGQPAPIGVAAELYIGGVCLADGYWGRPDLTAERFVVHTPSSGLRGTSLGTRTPEPGMRLYRTGDRARYWPDGTIELLGRIDQQVKIRGFRVEPGEVEAALAAHPAIAATVVVPVAGADGERELSAYVVPAANRSVDVAALRRYLADRLPPYLVPAHVVAMPALPLNDNGKVDRAALPAPTRRGSPVNGYVAPRDALEVALAGVWADVLGVERVGVHDNFFDLGGHSLKAAQAAARVRRLLRRDLPLAAFFRNPTVAGCRLALGPVSADEPTIAPNHSGSLAPASSAQRQLWFLHRLGQSADVYAITYRLHLAGRLDSAALERAFTALSARHDALRTWFVEADGQLWQTIDAPAPVQLSSEQPAGGFDFERGPLWFAAMSSADGEAVLTWSLHHLITDGQSMLVLIRDLAELYAAEVGGREPRLEPMPAGFADYCRRHDGPPDERLLSYWRERLTPPPVPLNLPATFARPKVASFRGGTVELTLPDNLRESLVEFGRREGVTPFVALLAAFEALLSRLCGQDDFAIGVPVSGRHRPDTDGLVGPVLNTLVIRADVGDAPTFRDFLLRVKRAVQDGLAHQDVPFDHLVRELRPQRDAGHQPLFQVLFSFSPEVPAVDVPGGHWTPEPVSNGTSKFDLSLWIGDGPAGLTGTFEFAADLFDADAIRRIAGHFRTILSAALAAPETPVADLPILTAAERAAIDGWNATVREVPARCVHELIADQAARDPGRIAVERDGVAVSYGELDARAERLARVLRVRGVGADVPVGLFVERTPDMLVAALAVWKAGGAYLPLDPAFPAERLSFYVRDSMAPVVIADAALADRLPLTNAIVLRPDATTDEPTDFPAVSPDDLAYVTYTSGSTGTPKGVMVRHAGLTNVLTSLACEPGLTASDRMLALTTLAFDIHTVELWLPLLVGATVDLVGRDTASDGRALLRKLRTAKPTVMQATPATWRMLVASGWDGSPGLTALCGGEELAADLAGQLLERASAVWNLYGPTETTVWSTLHRVENTNSPVPIGRPIANTTIHLLDPAGHELPVGVAGELAIGGAGVARGYLGQPELTTAKFVELLAAGRVYKTGDLAKRCADGTLAFIGRADHQVKIRGHRIELGEVEAALARQPGVQQAVVAPRREGGGNDSLIAYVVPANVDVEWLRRRLRESLPEALVPTHFVALDELPLTPNGKVNRARLPGSDSAAPRCTVPPRNEIERDLVEVWQDVLNVRPIGVTDDFFDLGGHSYLAAILMAALQTRLGHNLPLSALFECPTVEALAAAVQRRMEAGEERCLVPLREEGAEPPVFLIAGVGGHVFTFHKFVRLLGEDRPAYGIKAIGADGSEEPPDRVEAIAARYVEEIEDERPRGLLVLGGYSAGALIAYEVAVQLQARGRDIGPLVVFDMLAPGYPRPMAWPRRMAIHLRNVLTGQAKGAYLRQRFTNLREKVLRRLGLSRLVAPPGVEWANSLQQEALRKVWAALRTAQAHYQPQRRFDGPVLLFKAAVGLNWPGAVFDDPKLGWGRWADEVRVTELPGTHLELFREANLQPMADELRRQLADLA